MNCLKYRLSLWILPFVFLTQPLWAQETIEVHFMDVGYGDAILIRLPDSSGILIDAGDKEYGEEILAYLQAQNIQRLYLAIITHPHKNHFGGFETIAGQIPIERLLINGEENGEEGYESVLDHLRKSFVPIQPARRGMKIKHPGVPITLEILHPAALSGNLNDDSLVVWLRHRRASFLFTGDIGPEIQAQIIKDYPALQNVHGIQVPHHGGPIAESFAQFFSHNYKVLVISTGKNPWGQPKKEELKDLRGQIFRTDINGTVILESNGKKFYPLLPQ